MRQGVVAAHRHTPVHRQRHDKEIRRVIYTTKAIESFNSVISNATKNRRVFPSDRSAMKVVYLAIERAAQKWTVPVKDGKLALNRFAIEFEDRMPGK
jgi:transposase-like protein